MKMEAICILTTDQNDETEELDLDWVYPNHYQETLWVDLDRIHSEEDLYEQAEYYFGDKLDVIENELDILVEAGVIPSQIDL